MNMNERNIFSEQFKRITNRKYLYNIQPISNIDSIVRNGLLSNHLAGNILHDSIAMQSVQDRRDQVKVRNELTLHEYANVYFDYWNPMLSARRDMNSEICILVFSLSLLDIPNTIVSDRNAASSFVHFYPVRVGLQKIDFERVFNHYWTDDNPYLYQENKAIKCAEVLVPYRIDYSYVLGAVVCNEQGYQLMSKSDFDKQIVIRGNMFF